MSKAACFLLSFAAATAFAQTGPDKVQVSGYLDVYYSHNFTRSGRGETMNGRLFDIENDRPRISFAEVDFSQIISPWFSWTLQLFAGRSAEILHLTEPGGKSKYKWIRQGYVTFKGKEVTIDLGKFDTWVGYEAIDTRYQDQYSRSFNSTFSEPGYETGLRAAFAPIGKLTPGLYLVQGWNEVEDSNKGKSWGLSFNYQLDPKTNVILQNHSGVEGSNHPNDAAYFGGIGFVAPGTSEVHLLNLLVLRQDSGAVKCGLSVECGTSQDSPNKGKWNGEGLYWRRTLDPNRAVSIRLDRFEDTDALRSGVKTQLHSITAGYDHTVDPHLTFRLELRQDRSTEPFFLAGNGNLNKNRTTVTLAAIGKF